MLILLTSIVAAVPPIATEFYGSITDKGLPISSGTIYANTTGNVVCGTFTILNSGKYGLLSCKGDDPDTIGVEGAVGSEVIHYSIGSTPLISFGLSSWAFGEFREVNLSTLAVCTDLYCDEQQSETCSNCPQDCGLCAGNESNATGNFSGNNTGNQSGNGTGTGSGGGSGGQATSGTSGGGSSGGGAAGLPLECKERWECGIWRPRLCPPSEEQIRICRDLNNCQTTKDKPPTKNACKYQGSCRDDVKNNNETDVDCGGDLCDPCDIGFSCLIGRDCKSTYCDPSKFVCAFPEKPAPVITKTPPAELNIPGLVLVCGNKIPWAIMILMLILSSLPKILVHFYIKYYLPKYHKRYRTWKQEDKFAYQIKLRRRAHWLTIALLFVAAFVSFYAYLFFGCPDFLGLGLLILIIIALIIFYSLYSMMKFFEYHEERTHEELRKLMSKHLGHLQRLISIEQKTLAIIEKELLELWPEFQKSGEDNSIKEKLEPFTIELAETLDLRTKGKPIEQAEKKLVELAKPLLEDNLLKNLEERNSTFKRLMDRLRLLESHYKQAQGIEKEGN